MSIIIINHRFFLLKNTLALMNTLNRYLLSIGINVGFFFKWLYNFPHYIRTFFTLHSHTKNTDFPIFFNYPCLHDIDDNSWTANWHYFHQDLLVAQKIFQSNSTKHIDIWSRVDWFVAHVASFRNIEVFDIRKLENNIDNVDFQQLDLMKNIPEKYIEYTDSLSCLHTMEHFWLGRYGDTIDIDWHLKGFEQMGKILKKWWIFYFSTPIGEKQRIEFNAHRVFSLSYLIKMLWNNYTIESFSYVDDKWDLHKNITLNDDNNTKKTFWLQYWCGIFELRKN